MTAPNLHHIARPPTGADLLDEIETFLGRFVAYPTEAARVAHVLWVAHTWFMDRWESTPRIAFLSPEPGSGKTRALEVTEPLVPRPVFSVNTTPAYLFRKVSDPEGAPTILYDEIDTVFGPKAKDNEDTRALLNSGHRHGATAGRCVVKGKTVETEELPAYAAVALAGIDDLPDTIRSRAVIIHMRRRAPGQTVEPWRSRLVADDTNRLHDALAAWSQQAGEHITWPHMPEGISDRNADVWEALLAVADLAGGDWPERARCHAVTLVTDSWAGEPSIGVLLLRDLRTVFGDRDKMSTDDILHALHNLDESPWADLRGKPIDARYLSRHLRKYEVHSKTLRFPYGPRARGYEAGDLADPWSRYIEDGHAVTEPSWETRDNESHSQERSVGPPAQESVTSVTPVTTPDYDTLIGPQVPEVCPTSRAPPRLPGPPQQRHPQQGRHPRRRAPVRRDRPPARRGPTGQQPPRPHGPTLPHMRAPPRRRRHPPRVVLGHRPHPGRTSTP